MNGLASAVNGSHAPVTRLGSRRLMRTARIGRGVYRLPSLDVAAP